MAPHFSTLAWKILWTEEPGRLLGIRYDWATSLLLFTFMHWRRKWQPTPVFLPGESPGMGEPGGLPSMGSRLSSSSRTNQKRNFVSFVNAKTCLLLCHALNVMEVPRRILCDYLGQVPVWRSECKKKRNKILKSFLALFYCQHGWNIEKAREFLKNIYFCLLTIPKPFTV